MLITSLYIIYKTKLVSSDMILISSFFNFLQSHPILLNSFYFLSSVLANLPRILGWLSARAFLQAYWNQTIQQFELLQTKKKRLVLKRIFKCLNYLDFASEVSPALLVPVSRQLLTSIIWSTAHNNHIQWRLKMASPKFLLIKKKKKLLISNSYKSV